MAWLARGLGELAGFLGRCLGREGQALTTSSSRPSSVAGQADDLPRWQFRDSGPFLCPKSQLSSASSLALG